MYEVWETDVGDVGNAVGKQKKQKQESRKLGHQERRKQESRKVEKQEIRKLRYQESMKVGKQECRKVGKVVKVEKSGNQGSREVDSRKQEV